MSWIHYLLSDHYRTQMLTSHQQCWPYCADRNFGRLLTTSNTQLAECQVEPSDSCRPMMQIMPWLHALWPCPLDLCLLMYKPLWWSQWSICWYDFSWCSLWLDKLNISLSIPMYEDTPPPPRILSVSLRYGLSCLTGHNILSGTSGSRWGDTWDCDPFESLWR